MAVSPRISVIGLGYVGLPLVLALARHFQVVGYDIDGGRVAELVKGTDRTAETDPAVLGATSARLTAEADDLTDTDIFIITVPTPVDDDKRPDLRALESAARTIGGYLEAGSGAIVTLESTVYPGATEDVLGPALEAASGLRAGKDFFLGYSPERVNPGDAEHTHDRLTKVVAGQTPATTETLSAVYGATTSGGIYVARDIKTAEAAKVIENAQRDINIAFINEVARILHRLDISTHDVLDAAATKWNFLDFRPGLVGGHCIGVDPYYLAHRARQVGHEPEVILAGRRINDEMGEFVASEIAGQVGTGRVLMLGLTFKENVPDLRNSRVADLVAGLRAAGLQVDVHDPLADKAEATAVYGIDLLDGLADAADYDAVVGAVAHDLYKAFDADRLASLVKPGGLIADVKGMWRNLALADGLRRWQL
jgi:UDP-N-acetyl-D-glucosamine/UDP-N-acetyl-D-galactosamine dehydrogenase